MMSSALSQIIQKKTHMGVYRQTDGAVDTYIERVEGAKYNYWGELEKRVTEAPCTAPATFL